MAVPLESTLAELTLWEGYKVVFEAINPTTGAAVTGVVVSNIAIAGEDVSAPPGGTVLENVVPLLTPLALDEQSDDTGQAA